jgi:hypothetical protein
MATLPFGFGMMGGLPQAAAPNPMLAALMQAGLLGPNAGAQPPTPNVPPSADVEALVRSPGNQFAAPMNMAPPPPPPLRLPSGVGMQPPGPRTPELHSAEPTGSRGIAELYTQLPLMMAPVGPALNMINRGVGAVGRRVGSMMQSAPRTAGALGAGGATMLGTAETQETPPPTPELLEAQGRRGRAETARNEQQGIVGRLERDLARFGPDVGNRREGESAEQHRERVMELQRELGRATDAEGNPLYRSNRRDRQGRYQPGPIDGNWAGGTTAAAGARRAQLQEELKAAREELGRRSGAYDREDTAVSGIVRQLNRDAADRNRPWHRQIMRDYGDWIGLGLGLGAGLPLSGYVRSRLVGPVNRAREEAAAGANRLLDQPTNNIPGRVAGVNEFFVRGGQERPFRDSPRARGNFMPNNPLPDATRLYPPPAGLTGRLDAFAQPRDLGPAVMYGGLSGLGEWNMGRVERELTEARRRADTDPSRENMEALRRAEDRLETARLGARIPEGAALSYLTAMGIVPYHQFRPDVARGGREMNALLRWRNRR